jgi:hypothetical protein
MHSRDLLRTEPAASISLALGQTFLAMKPHGAASSERIERASQALLLFTAHTQLDPEIRQNAVASPMDF